MALVEKHGTGLWTLYLVCEMREEMRVRVRGVTPETTSDLALTWADGMLGCMPVFETMEDADNYVGDGNADVLEVYEIEKRNKHDG